MYIIMYIYQHLDNKGNVFILHMFFDPLFHYILINQVVKYVGI